MFAKYALLSRNKSKCGKIQYLENFDGQASFVDITKDDFGMYTDMVKARIKTVDNYYLKVCLIRELYEGKTSLIQYTYLSAILHCSDYKEIKRQLRAKGYTQSMVVKLIKKETGIKLPILKNNDYYKNLDTSKMCLYEKALILREYISQDNGVETTIKAELDDYIHLNNRLQLGLNPFSFAFCSRNVFHMINSNINETVSIKS